MSKFTLFNRTPSCPAALLCATVLLTACATPEMAPPTQSELNQVAHTLLADAVYTHTLLTQCAQVGPNLKAYSGDLALMWQHTHGEALPGADAQYSTTFAAPTEILEYNGEQLALDAIRFYHEQQARATQELRLTSRSLNNRKIFCERRLQRLEENLEQPPFTDSPSERELQALKALAAHSGAPKTMAEVPSLSGFIAPQQAPGRHYHRLEEQAKRDCAASELVVIANDWPRETYAHYCRGEAVALITCDWSECREH